MPQRPAHSVSRLLVAASWVALGSTAGVSAAALSVLSAGALEAAIAPLAARFERTSGHTVAVEYGTAPELASRLGGESSADVVIAPAAVVDRAIKDGRAVATSRVTVGRIGVGVFVRTGAPLPDISSEPALRAALLAAEHVVYTRGSSGQYVERLLASLGVANQLSSRLVQVDDAEAALGRVASGTVRDLGFGAVTAIKAFEGRGSAYAGPLPDRLQNFTTYDGAVMAGAVEPNAAAALLTFITSPDARRTLEQVGVQ